MWWFELFEDDWQHYYYQDSQIFFKEIRVSSREIAYMLLSLKVLRTLECALGCAAMTGSSVFVLLPFNLSLSHKRTAQIPNHVFWKKNSKPGFFKKKIPNPATRIRPRSQYSSCIIFIFHPPFLTRGTGIVSKVQTVAKTCYLAKSLKKIIQLPRDR